MAHDGMGAFSRRYEKTECIHQRTYSHKVEDCTHQATEIDSTLSSLLETQGYFLPLFFVKIDTYGKFSGKSMGSFTVVHTKYSKVQTQKMKGIGERNCIWLWQVGQYAET